MPRTDADQFRTGRFRCTWRNGGRHLQVDDTAFVDVRITAKLTEWRELAESIEASAAARELRAKQGGKGRG